jgi:hypothetical protein
MFVLFYAFTSRWNKSPYYSLRWVPWIELRPCSQFRSYIVSTLNFRQRMTFFSGAGRWKCGGARWGNSLPQFCDGSRCSQTPMRSRVVLQDKFVSSFHSWLNSALCCCFFAQQRLVRNANAEVGPLLCGSPVGWRSLVLMFSHISPSIQASISINNFEAFDT